MTEDETRQQATIALLERRVQDLLAVRDNLQEHNSTLVLKRQAAEQQVRALRAKLDVLDKALSDAQRERDQSAADLRRVDEVLARRPALDDEPDRIGKILKAIRIASRVERMDLQERRVATAMSRLGWASDNGSYAKGDSRMGLADAVINELAEAEINRQELDEIGKKIEPKLAGMERAVEAMDAMHGDVLSALFGARDVLQRMAGHDRRRARDDRRSHRHNGPAMMAEPSRRHTFRRRGDAAFAQGFVPLDGAVFINDQKVGTIRGIQVGDLRRGRTDGAGDVERGQ